MTAKPDSRISGSLRLAWLVVIMALVTAVGFALDLAWHRFAGLMFIVCAVGLVTVAVAEVLFWHQSASAWHERRPVAAFLAACVAIACSAGTLYTNYSTSAIGQDTKSAEKLTAFNKSDDLDKSIAERQARIAQLDAQLAAVPKRTADAAQADIDKAMAHKFWTATDGCKLTKGPQTRDFCSAYQGAVADKSNASAGVQARAERTNLTNELSELRTKRGSTEQVASKDNPAIAMLIGLGLSVEHAHVADSMVLPAVIQVIMALGGILLANEHARGREAKSWLPRWLSEWVKSHAYTAATGRHLSAADEYAQAASTPLKPAPVSGVLVGIKQSNLKTEFDEEQRRRAQARLQSMTEEAS
jgi:hypothetical protein